MAYKLVNPKIVSFGVTKADEVGSSFTLTTTWETMDNSTFQPVQFRKDVVFGDAGELDQEFWDAVWDAVVTQSDDLYPAEGIDPATPNPVDLP